jgi:methylmalonyl-CoA mutase cobalamin-binding subunit
MPRVHTKVHNMNFVFMLTRSDATITDCLDVVDEIRPVGLRHIGFKDVGIAPEIARDLVRSIRAAGATSYMEVVSTSREACVRSAQLARTLGVDRLLGGVDVDDVLAVLAGSDVAYFPFPGRPFDHPTRLAGTPDVIEADCQRFRERGCAGVDLLAYRATEADPIELVRAARRATDRTLLVAGSVATPAQIRALGEAGADAFTIGSAVFDGSFAPQLGSLRSQLKAVLDACR